MLRLFLELFSLSTYLSCCENNVNGAVAKQFTQACGCVFHIESRLVKLRQLSFLNQSFFSFKQAKNTNVVAYKEHKIAILPANKVNVCAPELPLFVL